MMAFLIGTQSYTFLSGFKNPWVCGFFPPRLNSVQKQQRLQFSRG